MEKYQDYDYQSRRLGLQGRTLAALLRNLPVPRRLSSMFDFRDHNGRVAFLGSKFDISEFSIFLCSKSVKSQFFLQVKSG